MTIGLARAVEVPDTSDDEEEAATELKRRRNLAQRFQPSATGTENREMLERGSGAVKAECPAVTKVAVLSAFPCRYPGAWLRFPNGPSSLLCLRHQQQPIASCEAAFGQTSVPSSDRLAPVPAPKLLCEGRLFSWVRHCCDLPVLHFLLARLVFWPQAPSDIYIFNVSAGIAIVPSTTHVCSSL
jgi:hypothetical protein